MVDRLSRAAWINVGLRSLASDGFGSLRPERLAKRLNVSRGSFYWHFTDVAAFEGSLLEEWMQVAVEEPYRRAKARGRQQPSASLSALIRRAFRSPDALERSVRAWAGASDAASAAVAKVDERRIELLTGMMARHDGNADRAKAVVLYWAYLGHVTQSACSADDKVLAVLLGVFAGECRDAAAGITSLAPAERVEQPVDRSAGELDPR